MSHSAIIVLRLASVIDFGNMDDALHRVRMMREGQSRQRLNLSYTIHSLLR